MRRPTAPALARLSAIAVAIAALGGCSSLSSSIEGKSVDYGSARATSDLDVPPDLTQLQRDPRYVMPDQGRQGTVSAVGYASAGAQASQTTSAVLPQFPDMHLQVIDGQRWLVVDAAPDALWPKVAAFWASSGLELKQNDAAAGVMQTEWAENRAQLPQDLIRKTLGKALDSIYDTSERDRYRTVVMRSVDGKSTQILITHETMVEVYTTPDHSDTRWTPGKADPALDDVMLNRLMVSLGLGEEKAKAVLASTAAPEARATLIDNGRALQLGDGFDEAWRRVGLAVNTAGFTVVDRDRSAGSYDVRYVNPQAEQQQQQAGGPGLFSRLFSWGKPADQLKPDEFHILVQADGSGSKLTVQPASANSSTASSASDILKVLQQQLQ